MRHCKKCGEEIAGGKILCQDCRRAWLTKRNIAYKQAQSELGPLCAANHQAIVKRIKELEKQL